MINSIFKYVWWYRPWHIVTWIYSEKDKSGLSVLKRQGTTYLMKILIVAFILWILNLILAIIGFGIKAEMNIYD